MHWDQYFAMLMDWKKLPAYKAEPRIDSLVGFYVQDALSDFLEVDIVGTIPELPIRKGTVQPGLEGGRHADQSYKVDFYCRGENGVHYFVEFKTDSRSRRESQDKYLEDCVRVGMRSVVEGILRIHEVTSYKKKYGHLLQKLRDLGVTDESNAFAGENDTIEVVYFQPSTKDGSERSLDFTWFANWLRAKYPGQEFELEFANAIEAWARD